MAPNIGGRPAQLTRVDTAVATLCVILGQGASLCARRPLDQDRMMSWSGNYNKGEARRCILICFTVNIAAITPEISRGMQRTNGTRRRGHAPRIKNSCTVFIHGPKRQEGHEVEYLR